jgi:hypothetical protein
MGAKAQGVVTFLASIAVLAAVVFAPTNFAAARARIADEPTSSSTGTPSVTVKRVTAFHPLR